MRHLKIVGSCLVAVFALSAIVSASASATLPEIYQCGAAAKVGKTYVGHYTAKTCTAASKVETGGKYEFEPFSLGSSKEKTGKKGKVKPFKGKGGPANLEIVKLGGVSCASSTDSGEFTSPKTAGDIVVIFKGCKFEGKTCSNTSKAGEVKTNPLVATVGYLNDKNKAAPVVGVRLSPETGFEYVEFSCLPLSFRVTHEGAGELGENNLGVIGEIDQKVGNPVNKFSKELTLAFAQSAGVQEWKTFEGAGEHDSLITQDQSIPFEKGKKSEATKAQSGEQTLSTGKGEELELVA
jgi:hypothetical protein